MVGTNLAIFPKFAAFLRPHKCPYHPQSQHYIQQNHRGTIEYLYDFSMKYIRNKNTPYGQTNRQSPKHSYSQIIGIKRNVQHICLCRRHTAASEDIHQNKGIQNSVDRYDDRHCYKRDYGNYYLFHLTFH